MPGRDEVLRARFAPLRRAGAAEAVTRAQLEPARAGGAPAPVPPGAVDARDALSLTIADADADAGAGADAPARDAHTLALTDAMATAAASEPPKRRRGRPPGKKRISALLADARARASAADGDAERAAQRMHGDERRRRWAGGGAGDALADSVLRWLVPRRDPADARSFSSSDEFAPVLAAYRAERVERAVERQAWGPETDGAAALPSDASVDVDAT